MNGRNFLIPLVEPFNPKEDVQRDIGFGGPSTEYLSTSQVENGWLNYPTIWWDKNGNPIHLSEEDALALSMEYEARTGRKLQRYEDMGQAVFGAMNRSAMGGANISPIFQNKLRNLVWE